jgi:hypothetical protein
MIDHLVSRHLLRLLFPLSLSPEVWDIVYRYLDVPNLKSLCHISRLLHASAAPFLFENVVATVEKTSNGSLLQIAEAPFRRRFDPCTVCQEATFDTTTLVTKAPTWENTERTVTPFCIDPEVFHECRKLIFGQLDVADVCRALPS